METLELGGVATWRPGRRSLIVAVTIALLVAGALAWTHRPRPLPDFTSTSMQDVYAGMVRGDDLNQWSQLIPRPQGDPDLPYVAPAECAVLFTTPLFQTQPPQSVDGVGTYYTSTVGDRTVAIQLLTWRYDSDEAAQHGYEAVKAAVGGCAGHNVRLDGVDMQLSAADGGSPAAGAPALAYTFVVQGSPLALHVMRYANTITWQFRMIPGDVEHYDPAPAAQLLLSLYQQLVAVRSALPR